MSQTKEKSKFSCSNCAAGLKFEPGATTLTCEYCGTKNDIPVTQEELDSIEEESLEDALDQTKEDPKELQEITSVKCTSCGAETTLKPNVTSDECPFCGTSLVIANKKSQKIIKPKALLPIKITEKQARDAYKSWIGSLWFAPNKVLEYSRVEGKIQGIYLPFWTFDFNTYTDYTGQRGDNYTVTENYTEYENNRPVTKTRTVTKTRWTPTSGNVENGFDDILVVATKSLPKDYLEKLEPWDLTSLSPYKDDYLSGFKAESYQVSLENGLEDAKKIIHDDITESIKEDIGGDLQTVFTQNTSYEDYTFKHILLPVWTSAYRYNGKLYRFIINAQTGEVHGERPYSYAKIVSAVIAATLAIIIVFSMLSKSSPKVTNQNNITPTSSYTQQNNYNNTNRTNSTLNTINNTMNAVGAGAAIYGAIKGKKPRTEVKTKKDKSYKVYSSTKKAKSYSKKK
ncbi:MAG: hypothetical protein U0457_14870 [Candidatus Sericytochromatia bacterium]